MRSHLQPREHDTASRCSRRRPAAPRGTRTSVKKISYVPVQRRPSMFELAQLDSRRAVVDQEQRHPFAVEDVRVRLDVYVDDVVLRACAGGPELLPVDHPVFAVTLGAGAHRADVRAGVGLGHRDGELHLAGKHFRDPVALLLLGALAQDVEPAEHRAAVGREQVEALVRELLGDDHHVDHVAAQAPVLLRERHAEEAHLQPFLIQLVGERLLAVEAADVLGRGDLGHHLAHALAQHALLFGEFEIHYSTPFLRSSPRISSVCSPRRGGGRKSISRLPSIFAGRCGALILPRA